MNDKTNITKAQLVEAYNTIAEEPVKTFKTVKAGLEACQNVLNEYDADEVLSIPEDIRTVFTDAGLTLAEPASEEERNKPKRKRGEWGSHCHERVFQAILDADNEPMTKEQIAEKAITTVAVVANAFYDFRRGTHTPEGRGVIAVGKVREDGAVKYYLELDEEQSEDEEALRDALVA